MNKVLVFDMDGTITDFYGVEGWLDDLHRESPRPYIEAQPFYSPEILNTLLLSLKKQGWRVVVTTWLAKGSSPSYCEAVKNAKLDWLSKYSFPYDEVHITRYGVLKDLCTRKLGGFQILIDDNEQVRKDWQLGKTIDARTDIIEDLIQLME